MKNIVFILILVCFSTSFWAQQYEQQTDALFMGNSNDKALNEVKAESRNPKYIGASFDAGFMFTPNHGSALYIAPKLRFQTTPRLFINAGVGIVQYYLPPSQLFSEARPSYQQRTSTATGTYVFLESSYLLSERWSLNGSMMKNATPESMKNITPYRIPSEAAHFGVDFKITPNISVGARVGYSN